MKILNIGDLHGRPIWKALGDIDELLSDIRHDTIVPSRCLFDLYIFSGDYVDDFKFTDDEIYKNLVTLIGFKKAYPDKVVLLIGNHDLQYMFDEKMFGCSGFRPSMKKKLYKLFNDNIELFTPIFTIQRDSLYIWTHAGISKDFYDNEFNEDVNTVINKAKKLPIEELILNQFQQVSPYTPIFYAGSIRGGKHNHGGIFWADKFETENNMLPNTIQIIGHTHIQERQIYTNPFLCSTNYYIDHLGPCNEPLILDI